MTTVGIARDDDDDAFCLNVHEKMVQNSLLQFNIETKALLAVAYVTLALRDLFDTPRRCV